MYLQNYKDLFGKLLDRYKYFGILFPILVSMLSIINVALISGKIRSAQFDYYFKPFFYITIFNIPFTILILWLLMTSLLNFIDNILMQLDEEKNFSRLFLGIGYGFIFFFLSQFYTFYLFKFKIGDILEINGLTGLVSQYGFNKINTIAFFLFSLWCVFINKIIYRTKIYIDVLILVLINSLYFFLSLLRSLWQNTLS